MVFFRVKRECQLIAAPQTWTALLDGMIESIYKFFLIKKTCLIPQQFLYISSGTGSCPTKWPFDFLQPRKSLDGNRTCHWIDLIEATGGNSSFYCQFKESLVYVQIQFSCMITDPRVGIEWKIYQSCTTGGSHKVSKALFAICVLTILFNILLFAVILSKKELRQQVHALSNSQK